jgi:hypothetical protein
VVDGSSVRRHHAAHVGADRPGERLRLTDRMAAGPRRGRSLAVAQQLRLADAVDLLAGRRVQRAEAGQRQRGRTRIQAAEVTVGSVLHGVSLLKKDRAHYRGEVRRRNCP